MPEAHAVLATLSLFVDAAASRSLSAILVSYFPLLTHHHTPQRQTHRIESNHNGFLVVDDDEEYATCR